MFRPMGKPPVVFEKKNKNYNSILEWKGAVSFLTIMQFIIVGVYPKLVQSFQRISAEKQKESTVQRCLAQAVVQRSTAPGAKALQSKEFVHRNHWHLTLQTAFTDTKNPHVPHNPRQQKHPQ